MIMSNTLHPTIAEEGQTTVHLFLLPFKHQEVRQARHAHNNEMNECIRISNV